MSEETPKMEKDYSAVVDVQLPEAQKLAKSGKLREALDQLLVLEKQTRVGADMVSNSRVLVTVITLCFEAKDFKLLNEHIVLLSKKHGLLKQAVVKMVQQAMTFMDQTPDLKTKLELIDTLRTVTEGKIFVEVERARVTRILSQMKEKEGKVVEAADILQELQVETFGSMERREKTDFILEQMRLCLAKKDFTRVQIISKKISAKFFDKPENADLKIRFYELMVQHGLHDDQYLNVCKYYRSIFDTPTVLENEQQWKQALQNVVLFACLSPFDHEQSDLIHRIHSETKLAQVPLLKDFVKCFITNELMRWPKMEEIYGAMLKGTYVFSLSTEDGKRRYKDLHQRIVEHNIRVVSNYYTRISVKRLTQLLDLSPAETESTLSKLVTSKTIHAKIDRLSGVINFTKPKDANVILNEWSQSINGLLELIVKTNHLITKEEMVHSIAKVAV